MESLPNARDSERKPENFLSYTWKEKTLFLRRSRICFSSKTFFFLKPYLVIFAKKKLTNKVECAYVCVV